MSDSSPRQPSSVTVSTLRGWKREGRRFSALTAYDATFARVLDGAGIDVILVGDSLGMVIHGRKTTVPVSVDDLVYHSRCVSRGVSRALLMADMPFLSFASPARALDTAARLMQEGMAQMVKLEGGGEQAQTVSLLSAQGVPVCAHLGLRPQTVHKLGGFKVQGRGEQAAAEMLDDARRLEDAGAEILLLECVPSELAGRITEAVSAPVIGIGAGPACDGQILVLYDMIGVTPGRKLRFAKDFLEGTGSVSGAISRFAEAVRSGAFPGPEHSFE